MSIWKPTKEQLKLIRDAAKKETGMGRIELQPGNRYNTKDNSVESSMNMARVSKSMNDMTEDTDLLDHSDWNTFKKGVELTHDGCDVVDFYCYSRNGLESNIVVYYEAGDITSIEGVFRTLFSK